MIAFFPSYAITSTPTKPTEHQRSEQNNSNPRTSTFSGRSAKDNCNAYHVMPPPTSFQQLTAQLKSWRIKRMARKM
jgi:hypothetical protein